MWLCFFPGRQFEDTFENPWWRQVKQMKLYKNCLVNVPTWKQWTKSRKLRVERELFLKILENREVKENSFYSTLSAVKSNVFFEKFKVKSNGKKSEVQRVLDFTFFTVGLHFLLKWSPTVKKVKSNGCWTSLFFKVKSNTCAPFPR